MGRVLAGGVGIVAGSVAFIVAFIGAFASLIGMRFAARRCRDLSLGLLAAFGLLMGLATARMLASYASADRQVLWQAGGATAVFIGLFIGGFFVRISPAPTGADGSGAAERESGTTTVLFVAPPTERGADMCSVTVGSVNVGSVNVGSDNAAGSPGRCEEGLAT